MEGCPNPYGPTQADQLVRFTAAVSSNDHNIVLEGTYIRFATVILQTGRQFDMSIRSLMHTLTLQRHTHGKMSPSGMHGHSVFLIRRTSLYDSSLLRIPRII